MHLLQVDIKTCRSANNEGEEEEENDGLSTSLVWWQVVWTQVLGTSCAQQYMDNKKALTNSEESLELLCMW